MKESKLVAILAALLLTGLVLFAQAQPSTTPQEASTPGMKGCPMMGNMPGSMGNMQGMMKGMPQQMASRFSLSADEIFARLTEKKAQLGLSEAQVKQVADLIASSEQQKIKDSLRGMMGAMRGGKMNCPCMQSATKMNSTATH